MNHLAVANAMKCMLRGRFSVPSVMEESGLGRTTVYELLNTFEGQGLISPVEKIRDCTGRKRIEVFEISPSAIGSLYRFSKAQ